MRNKPPYPLASVDNALRLLEVLRDRGRIRVSDAAEELGVARSTAHRLLAMLAYRNFAIQDESRGYIAGPALAVSSIGGSPTLQQFRRATLPFMEALCSQVGETVNLMVRVGTQTRFLATVESAQLLHVGDRQGAVLAAHKSSGGKALLAALSEDELRYLYLVKDTGKAGRAGPSIGGRGQREPVEGGANVLSSEEFQDLMRELHLVRQRGYALNQEATESGVSAIGRRLIARSLHQVGALSISVPSARLPASRVEVLAEALRAATTSAEAAFED